MARENQPILPGFEEVFEELETKRTSPQPRIEHYRPPRLYELRSHPLDLRFKGRLRKWLKDVPQKHGFNLGEVLPEYYQNLIELYLFDDRWPSQEDVMSSLGENSNTPLRPILQRALLRVWRRIKNGPRAVELLNFDAEDNFIYHSIIRFRVEEDEGSYHITTIDELAELSGNEVRKIAGARPMFETLKKKMNKYFPDWDPQIKFRQELPADEAEELN